MVAMVVIGSYWYGSLWLGKNGCQILVGGIFHLGITALFLF